MLYIEAEPRPAAPAPQSQAGGAFKFHGAVAEGYDDKREKTDKWLVEQRVITEWLSELPEGSNVLDCPVGTGRFLPHLVARKLPFVGLDISGDMLVQAALKIVPQEQVEQWVAICNERNQVLPLRIKDKGVLSLGDIRKTGAPDKAVDVAVCCRITRWLIGNHGPQGIIDMLREMQRVARKQIILTARVENHKFAVTEDLIRSGLSGWRITRNVAGYETAYRIIMLEPV